MKPSDSQGRASGYPAGGVRDHESPSNHPAPLGDRNHYDGCRASLCAWPGSEENCPRHGVAAYYRRCAAKGRDSGD